MPVLVTALAPEAGLIPLVWGALLAFLAFPGGFGCARGKLA